MDRYYVLRRDSVFRIIFMNVATAELWFKRGWEINAHSFAMHGEAEAEIKRWKRALGKKTTQLTPSRSQPTFSSGSSESPSKSLDRL
jgi:hypothetical protein